MVRISQSHPDNLYFQVNYYLTAVGGCGAVGSVNDPEINVTDEASEVARNELKLAHLNLAAILSGRPIEKPGGFFVQRYADARVKLACLNWQHRDSALLEAFNKSAELIEAALKLDKEKP